MITLEQLKEEHKKWAGLIDPDHLKRGQPIWDIPSVIEIATEDRKIKLTLKNDEFVHLKEAQ